MPPGARRGAGFPKSFCRNWFSKVPGVFRSVERRFSHQRTIRTTGTSSRHSNLSTSYCRNDRVPTWTISPCSKTMNRLNSSFRRLVLRDLVKASGEPLLLLSKNDKLVVRRAEHPALPVARQPRFGGL